MVPLQVHADTGLTYRPAPLAPTSVTGRNHLAFGIRNFKRCAGCSGIGMNTSRANHELGEDAQGLRAEDAPDRFEAPLDPPFTPQSRQDLKQTIGRLTSCRRVAASMLNQIMDSPGI
jgi:hypothetical protein